ncbi:MAG: hypothetical protein WEE89_00705 [Gemmatimonadota bacterium]
MEHGECIPDFAIGEIEDLVAQSRLEQLAELLEDDKTALAIDGGVGLKSSCSDLVVAAFPMGEQVLRTLHTLGHKNRPDRRSTATAFVDKAVSQMGRLASKIHRVT